MRCTTNQIQSCKRRANKFCTTKQMALGQSGRANALHDSHCPVGHQTRIREGSRADQARERPPHHELRGDAGRGCGPRSSPRAKKALAESFAESGTRSVTAADENRRRQGLENWPFLPTWGETTSASRRREAIEITGILGDSRLAGLCYPRPRLRIMLAAAGVLGG
jgi:hypothetical protein